MTTETTIHVPTTEFDVAIAAEMIRRSTHIAAFTGEELTVGAYLGDGRWELLDVSTVGAGGFAPVPMTEMPGEVVGTVWIENVNGTPTINWDRA